jgi:hypothetical protein
MNHTHINRYWANRIILWCIDNLGVSKYHKSLPKVVLSNKLSTDCYGQFIFETNTITIYVKKCKSFKLFVSTLIHEYVHHLQDLANYNIETDDIETEAINAENKYTLVCIDYLNSLSYL